MASIYVCSFTMLFGACIFLQSFCVDFCQRLRNLDEMIRRSPWIETSSSSSAQSSLKATVVEVIRFHANIKQLRMRFPHFSYYFVLCLRRSFVTLHLFPLPDLFAFGSFNRLLGASTLAFREMVSILLINTASMWCVALLELQVVRSIPK